MSDITETAYIKLVLESQDPTNKYKTLYEDVYIDIRDVEYLNVVGVCYEHTFAFYESGIYVTKTCKQFFLSIVPSANKPYCFENNRELTLFEKLLQNKDVHSIVYCNDNKEELDDTEIVLPIRSERGFDTRIQVTSVEKDGYLSIFVKEKSKK